MVLTSSSSCTSRYEEIGVIPLCCSNKGAAQKEAGGTAAQQRSVGIVPRHGPHGEQL
jgi:hypothetical protein